MFHLEKQKRLSEEIHVAAKAFAVLVSIIE